MCKVLKENASESVEAYLAKKPAGFQLRKNLLPLETIYKDINRILSPFQQDSSSSEQNTLNTELQSEKPSNIVGPGAPSVVQVGPATTTEGEFPILEPSPTKNSDRSAEQYPEKDRTNSPRDGPAVDSSTRTGSDVGMEEKQHCEADSSSEVPDEESTEKPEPRVVILED